MSDNLKKIQVFYEWLQYSKAQIPPGTLDHIDLTKPLKWELQYKEQYGRCLVAIEHIKEGDVLFIDHPVITGPKQNCEPMCLGCYKQLDELHQYTCSRCHLPVCGRECETRGYHPLECEVYKSSGYRPLHDETLEDNPMYESMLPLRCLLLEKYYPQKWQTLVAMESHDQLRKGTELWETEQKNVCEYLRNKVKLNVPDEKIHTITGILDVNCHEVRSNIPNTRYEYRVRGLYPLCAMMSHDCCSNTHHTVMDDMLMIVVASRDIPKGNQLTGTYTHLLSGTIERRKHLKYGKFFDCVCDRCKDPTELGTYFSALRCSKSKCGGNVLPLNPLHPTNSPDFVCDRCGFEVKSSTVSRLTNMIYHELQTVAGDFEKNPLELEMIYRKYQGVLHPNHFHLIGIEHSLSQMYGRVEGHLIGELSASRLQRKIECCKDLLRILDILDPGISRLRGLTLYELHAPILLRANRAFQTKGLTKKEFVETLQECLSYLETAIHCLQFEPLSSFEGEICKIAKGSAAELKKWIQTVTHLPDSKFLQTVDQLKKDSFDEDMTLESLLKKIEEY